MTMTMMTSEVVLPFYSLPAVLHSLTPVRDALTTNLSLCQTVMSIVTNTDIVYPLPAYLSIGFPYPIARETSIHNSADVKVSRGSGRTGGVLVMGLRHSKDHLWKIVFIVIIVEVLFFPLPVQVPPTGIGHRDEHRNLHAIVVGQRALSRAVLAGRCSSVGHIMKRRQRIRPPRKRIVKQALVERGPAGRKR
jgi:hypothetical protein